MQITPPPPLPPASAGVAQPQSVQNGLPQIVTQAAAPITPVAVSPADKSERSDKSRRRRGGRDREDPQSQQQGGDRERGGHLNISV
ncbi:MAG: hypothetical protein EOM37_04180 [Proteobacteria bacterium]|nr:hypothetical protein [Alphaproteobacteria bacterium]NCC03231.1 hypothetical protein [Pseudomonadota bacterium]